VKLHPTLHGLIKALLIALAVVVAIITPFFVWKTIAPRSYENFLLHSVSPLTRDSRRAILEKRQGMGPRVGSGILP